MAPQVKSGPSDGELADREHSDCARLFFTLNFLGDLVGNGGHSSGVDVYRQFSYQDLGELVAANPRGHRLDRGASRGRGSLRLVKEDRLKSGRCRIAMESALVSRSAKTT